MNFKIIKAVHVTATERKHLSAFLDSGRTQAKINRKTYVILQGSPIGSEYEYKIGIYTPYISEISGKSELERQTIILQTKQAAQ